MSSSSSYSWMPGWLRKFMNLDDEMPSYEPSSTYVDGAPARPSYSYAPPARSTASYTPSAATYTPPALPPAAYGQDKQPEEASVSRFAASYPGAQTSEEAVKRFSSFSSAPPSSASPTDESGQRPAGPPPLTPRGANGNGQSMIVPGPISQAAANGFVQPIGFAVRSFARGAMPPQGIEQFSRELRATATDVWNFYTYWIRFETEDLFQMGREAVDAVTGLLPPMGEEVAKGTQPRRINVAQASNGEGNGGPKRTTPPPPPAPTAVFSPTVTADDAAIPPTGKDTSAEFAARMAKETAPVAKDVADSAKKLAEGVKSDAPATPPTTPTPPAASSSAPSTPAPPKAPGGAAGTPSAGTQSKDKGQGNKGKK